MHVLLPTYLANQQHEYGIIKGSMNAVVAATLSHHICDGLIWTLYQTERREDRWFEVDTKYQVRQMSRFRD